MNNLIKIFFTALFVAIHTLSSFADEKITFKTNAPMIVSVGEAFRVEFSLNAKPDKDTFVAPKFEGFDVMAGPAVSQGSSTSWVNGKVTSSVNYSITFVLLPQQSGNVTIGAAEISVDGTRYTTTPTPIEIRDGATTSGGGSSGNANNSQQGRESQAMESRAGNQINKDDILLRLSLSRSSVYKGEAVRATLKLYSRVNLAGIDALKNPSFNGFWSQQNEVEQGPFRETLNNKVYDTYNLAEWLLYPQQSGTLKIEPAQLTAVIQVIVQSNRGFDPFFGGGHEIYNVRRELQTPEVKLQVKEFPTGAPASFTGAVGKYNLSAKLSTPQVVANSAANITVRIAGAGNLNFMQAPTLTLPTSFELYDIKSTEQINTTASGSTGYKSFEYPFIARAEGDYTIAPIEFTYFNPENGRYVTLSSEQFSITVTPDQSRAATAVQGLITTNNKEDVRLLASDIHFIKLGSPSLLSTTAPLMFSPLYWLILTAMVVLAAALYIILRKRIQDNRNTVLVKGRRANKVAIQRFRSAARYMKEQNRRAFYQEMLRALWGYISDRFNIPVADLTKESIREELNRRGATEEAQAITEIISRCEEAQYSPIATATMESIYADGIEIVSKIESKAKR